jgi:hypothetical protein
MNTGSPLCNKERDKLARDYLLSPEDSAGVDQILASLKAGQQPGGAEPSQNLFGGNLAVAIDVEGFKQQYRRSIIWESTLTKLEPLLKGVLP